ncbi:MAG: YlxM family DNA-binding protein [Syntrophomonadaceae bacterium]|nr:YlxM family DNA-binding protein [Syntrophomonadaceae bacterium]
MLEKLDKLVILFDFYGPLLTERQKQVFELHYEADLGLSEVAQQMAITRQGVFDLLKRTEQALERYEEKLMLVHRFQEDRKKIEEAYLILSRPDHNNTDLIAQAADRLAQVLNTDSIPKGVDGNGF